MWGSFSADFRSPSTWANGAHGYTRVLRKSTNTRFEFRVDDPHTHQLLDCDVGGTVSFPDRGRTVHLTRMPNDSWTCSTSYSDEAYSEPHTFLDHRDGWLFRQCLRKTVTWAYYDNHLLVTNATRKTAAPMDGSIKVCLSSDQYDCVKKAYAQYRALDDAADNGTWQFTDDWSACLCVVFGTGERSTVFGIDDKAVKFIRPRSVQFVDK